MIEFTFHYVQRNFFNAILLVIFNNNVTSSAYGICHLMSTVSNETATSQRLCGSYSALGKLLTVSNCNAISRHGVQIL